MSCATRKTVRCPESFTAPTPDTQDGNPWAKPGWRCLTGLGTSQVTCLDSRGGDHQYANEVWSMAGVIEHCFSKAGSTVGWGRNPSVNLPSESPASTCRSSQTDVSKKRTMWGGCYQPKIVKAIYLSRVLQYY